MKATELAWAAGFFDGEGSIVYKAQRYTTVGGEKRVYPAIVVSVSQTDRRPIDRFAAVMGELGNVHGPYRNGAAKNKPILYWRTEHRESAAKARALLDPYLSDPKREQWDAVLEKVRQNERTKHP